MSRPKKDGSPPRLPSLVKQLSRLAGNKPAPAYEPPPPLHPRDRNSKRARAAHARMRRALVKRAENREPSRYTAKRRWPGIGYKGGPQPPLGLSVLHRMIGVMEPGHWYAWPDIGRAAGLIKRDWDGVRKFSGGYIELRRNPAYRSPETARTMQELTALSRAEPMWLYRLTPVGERFKRLVTLLG